MGQPMDAIKPTQTGGTPPEPAGALCRVCGRIILNVTKDGVPAWDGIALVHDLCQDKPGNRWSAGVIDKTLPPGHDDPLGCELRDIIHAGIATTNSRGAQVTVGPSEIGNRCDRRLAMRLAGVPSVNYPDPWAAEVGTAVHSRMEQFIELANRRGQDRGRFITEQPVQVTPFLQGRSDLYDQKYRAVVDWKTASPTSYKKMASDGAPIGYQIQGHLYGLGWVRAGYPVDFICLAILPKAGRLRDLMFFRFPFDPAVAQEAINRMQRVGQLVVNLQASHGNRDFWADIPGSEDHCGYCPYFCRSRRIPSRHGCPGAGSA